MIMLMITRMMFIVLSQNHCESSLRSLQWMWACGTWPPTCRHRAPNLTLEFAGNYQRPDIHPSPFALLSHKSNTHFTLPRRLEGWVELDTKVSVQSVSKLRIAVVFLKDTETVCGAGSIRGSLALQSDQSWTWVHFADPVQSNPLH